MAVSVRRVFPAFKRNVLYDGCSVYILLPLIHRWYAKLTLFFLAINEVKDCMNE